MTSALLITSAANVVLIINKLCSIPVDLCKKCDSDHGIPSAKHASAFELINQQVYAAAPGH